MSRSLFHAHHIFHKIYFQKHIFQGLTNRKVIKQSFKQTRLQKSILEFRLPVGNVNLFLIVITDGASPRYQQVIQPCYSHDSSGV